MDHAASFCHAAKQVTTNTQLAHKAIIVTCMVDVGLTWLGLGQVGPKSRPSRTGLELDLARAAPSQVGRGLDVAGTGPSRVQVEAKSTWT